MNRVWTLTLAAVLLTGCVSSELAQRNLANVRAKDAALATAGVPDPAPDGEKVAAEILGTVESAGDIPKIPVGGTPLEVWAGIAALGLTMGKTLWRTIKARSTTPPAAPAPPA